MGRSSAGEPLLETLAYGVDGDEYSATMLTRNDFGCVQFKPTAQKPPERPVYVPAEPVPKEDIKPPTFVYLSQNGLPLTKEQKEHNRKQGL